MLHIDVGKPSHLAITVQGINLEKLAHLPREMCIGVLIWKKKSKCLLVGGVVK